jgi:PAS domain S-box-containing protein
MSEQPPAPPFYQALIEYSPTGMLVATADRTIFTNPAATAILGYTPAEFATQAFFSIIHGEDAPAVAATIEDVLATPGANAMVEMRVQHKDGCWRHIEATAVNLTTYDAVGALVCHFRDVSDRVLAEQALRTREAQLLYAQQLGQMGHWQRDLATNMLVWSDAMYVLWDISPGTPLTHEAAMALIHRDDYAALQAIIDTSIREQSPYQATYRVVRPDGSVRHVQSRGAPILDGQGRIVALFGVAQDITEQHLIEAERARLLDEVQTSRLQMQQLSHQVIQAQEQERRTLARELHDEIGAKLTGLSLALSNEAVSRSAALAMVTEVMEQVRSIATMLRPTVLDDFGLGAGLTQLVERYIVQTGITIAFEEGELAERRFPVEVENAVYRIVQESLTNIARHAQVRCAAVELWFADGMLWGSISDAGVGFDVATVSTASTGLTGMRERAHLLGGQVTIRSVPGVGTTVHLTIPIAENA